MTSRALILVCGLGLGVAGFAASPAEDFAAQLEQARGGDRSAQASVGTAYARGLGVLPNQQEAVKWWRLAGEQGDVESQKALASFYYFLDPAEGRRWSLLAAEQGDALSEENLGNASAEGVGIKPDPVEALKWFRRAAEHGRASSMHQVAILYAAGRGVERNLPEAMGWERQAAEAGYAPAQFALAEACALGNGVPLDGAQAMEWYRKAAGQGHARAIAKLSDALYTGKGLGQDYVEFLAWITVKAVPQDAAEIRAMAMADLERFIKHQPVVDENAQRRRKAEKTVGPDGVRAALKRADEIEEGIAASPAGQLARLMHQRPGDAVVPAVAPATSPAAAVAPAVAGPAPGAAAAAPAFGSRFKELFKSKDVHTMPAIVTRKAPFYPFDMRRAGITGYVEVEFIIDTVGDVVEARVVKSSNVAFEEPALQAVRAWKFKPGKVNTRAVNVLASQRVEFGIGR